MPAFFLYGDNFLVEQAVREIKSEYQATDLLEGNHTTFDSNNFETNQCIQICKALPFLDNKRFVIVTDVIKNNTTIIQNISDQISDFPESTILIMKEHTEKISAPVTKILNNYFSVKQLTAPKSTRQINQWIKDRSTLKGISISPTGIQALSSSAGNDLWSIENELEKLNLYCKGNPITEIDVAHLVHSNKETNIFNTVDSIVEKNKFLAFSNIKSLINEGNDVFSIIRLIERQLRLIALAKYFLSVNTSLDVISQKMNIRSDFIMKKLISQSARLSDKELDNMFSILVDTDLKIKTGKLEASLALDLFVNEVT